MFDLPDAMQRLASTLLHLTPNDGFTESLVKGVTLMRANTSLPPIPVLQEPTIVIVAQGLKRGYIGSEVIRFNAGECLVVAVPTPFHCDTVVDQNGPMLALAIRIDMPLVAELITKMDAEPLPDDTLSPSGMAVMPLDEALIAIVGRLLAALASPLDARILGPQLIRELTYRILQSSAGRSLHTLVALHGRFRSIYQACDLIQVNYAQPLDIATLADAAGMSMSAFHHAFKTVTDYSPIQYLKIIRLHRARERILAGQGIAQSAYDVGYVSTSQFSREFKRLFGYVPTDAVLHQQRG